MRRRLPKRKKKRGEKGLENFSQSPVIPMDRFYTSNECDDISGFESGYEVFDRYLHEHDGVDVIHYVLDAETDNLVAYFTLLASALPYAVGSRTEGIPAVELKMFATDKKYQGLGLGTLVFDEVLETIEHLTSDYIGAKIILLYSVPVKHVMDLYLKKGFREVSGAFTAFESDFTQGCVPMYKVIRVEQMQASK